MFHRSTSPRATDSQIAIGSLTEGTNLRGAAAPEPANTQTPAPEAGDEKTTFIKEDDTDA